MKYLNTLVSVVGLAQRIFKTVKRNLQMHQYIVETWDDSGSITAVKAQKIGDMLQKWWHSHSEAQYQGSEINS